MAVGGHICAESIDAWFCFARCRQKPPPARARGGFSESTIPWKQIWWSQTARARAWMVSARALGKPMPARLASASTSFALWGYIELLHWEAHS